MKAETLRVSVDSATLAVIEAALADEDYETVSQWVRAAIREKLERRQNVHGVDSAVPLQWIQDAIERRLEDKAESWPELGPGATDFPR